VAERCHHLRQFIRPLPDTNIVAAEVAKAGQFAALDGDLKDPMNVRFAVGGKRIKAQAHLGFGRLERIDVSKRDLDGHSFAPARSDGTLARPRLSNPSPIVT